MTTIDYYKMLSDPSHAWLNDPDSPFRTPSGLRNSPCIYFKFRTFIRKSRRCYGSKPKRLVYPVAERPYLRWYRNGSWGNRQVMSSEKLSRRQRFNYQMERLIKHWHGEADVMHCAHEKPYLVMEDDSFTELFHL